MPGIVGLITKQPRAVAEHKLSSMLETILHESFYVSGTWFDERSGIYLGWAARKGSFADCLPLSNERGDLVLFFAGEEYPDPSSITSLKTRGHEFDSGGGAYLVHVAEEDTEFPRGLNGRFQGILIDRKTATAKLFNDRYGMHRVYYHESHDDFYFAAEAKAILKTKPELRSINEQSLGEFIACGCVMEDRTLFKGIGVLPPGSAWIFRNGALKEKGKYFDPSEWENQGALEPEAYYDQLRDVFSRNLPRYFAGREKIAISLTGGLDSRMIMAWAKTQPGSLPSYTFGGPFRECHDVRVARTVAHVCGQPYQVIPVGDEFLSRFAHYAERTVYLSDGCAAVSRASDLYTNELAAQIAPVRMTGNYGSEILRRLRAFKPGDPAPGLFDPSFVAYVDAAKQTYSSIFKGHAVSFTAFRQAPWYQYGLLALEQTQLGVRSPFLDNDLVRTAFRAPKSDIVKSDLFENNGDCNRLIKEGSPALYQIPTDRGLGGSDGFPSRISRAILEFSFKAEYAYDYGMPQWMARLDHSFSMLHLERLFLGRHKFCHFRVWYRDQLADYVREILLDSRTLSRSYINRATLQEMVQKHLQGTANYTTEIHRLLTIELQHRVFIDAN
jgi:asparagine synthase (glutamine-hydrolysing)